MTDEEGLTLLAEDAALKPLAVELPEQIEGLSRQVAELEKRQGTPSFVKGNRPKKEGPVKDRKKRAVRPNQARRREEPTRVERHAVEAYTNCGCHLSGESEGDRRQVIELPAPQPVEIIELTGW